MNARSVSSRRDALDGSPATQTVGFCVDEQWYEIDLGDRSAQRLRAELGVYIQRARVRRPAVPPQRIASVRAWARDHGYRVGDRGQLPHRVVAAYVDAQRQR